MQRCTTAMRYRGVSGKILRVVLVLACTTSNLSVGTGWAFDPYAADPYGNSPTVPASETSPTSPSSSTTSSDPTTNWMSGAPLSSPTSTPTTVNGAYVSPTVGSVYVEDLEGNDYAIVTSNGTRLGPANEVAEVKFSTPINGNSQELSDAIDTGPTSWTYDAANDQKRVESFVTLQAGGTALLSDELIQRSASNSEPMETLPNFVMVNGEFVALAVNQNGSNPLGSPKYNVSFTVPSLKGNGQDKIKFLSPYDDTRVLARAYAVSHDASMWARLGERNKSDLSAAYVTLISNTGTRVFGTGLSEGTKVNDFYFTPDGLWLVLKTEDGRNIYIDTQTGLNAAYTSGHLSQVTEYRFETEERGLTNLFRGTSPQPYSSSGTPFYGNPPPRAVDGIYGNTALGWVGVNATGVNDFLVLDLGAVKEIERIKYDSRYSLALSTTWQAAFTLSGSLDGVNWFPVIQRSGLTQSQLFDFRIPATKFRYLKVHNIQSRSSTSSTWQYAYVAEIEAYEKHEIVDHVIPTKETVYEFNAQGRLAKISESNVQQEERGVTNLVRGLSPQAHSSISYYGYYDTTASRATDGKYGTQDSAWLGNTSNGINDSLVVDLREAKDIERIKYDTRYSPNDLYFKWQDGFTLSGSLDGVNWFPLVNQPSLIPTALFYEFTIPLTKVRYLKVHNIQGRQFGSTTFHYAYVQELEAYEKRETVTRRTPTQETVYTYDAQGRLMKLSKYGLSVEERGLTNFLRGIVPQASSYYNIFPYTGTSTFPPSLATDGVYGDTYVINTNLGWQGANVNGINEYLITDLGQVKEIERIKYDTRYGPGYISTIWQEAFTISGSVDGINWFPVIQRSGLTQSDLFDFSITPTNVRYLKVSNILSRNSVYTTWHYAYVAEIEAYEKRQTLINRTLISETISLWSPDGQYSVTLENGYYVLRDQASSVLGSIQALAGEQFTVGNKGLYVTGTRNGQLYLELIPYSNYTRQASTPVSLPAEIPSPTAISFIPDPVGVAEIVGSNTGIYRVDLDTGKIIYTLTPWVTAKSNPNFSFRLENTTTTSVLWLRNNLTGVEKTLAETTFVANDPTTGWMFYDVSPDGKSVFYSNPAGSTLERLDDGRKATISTQALTDYGFTAYNEIAISDSSSRTLVFDLATLAAFSYRLYQNAVISPSGRYEVKDERLATGRLLVTDHSASGVTQPLTSFVTEAPLLDFNVTDSNGIYYISGHDALPVVRHASYQEIFSHPGQPAKETVTLEVTPRDRNAIELLPGRPFAYVTDSNGKKRLVDLRTGKEISNLVISPSTTLALSDITSLPLQTVDGSTPRSLSLRPQGASADATPTSRGMQLQYNTASAGWAGASFDYDNLATPEIETADFSGLNSLVIGLKADTSEVRMEIVDQQDQRAAIVLTNIRSDIEQVWAISLSQLQGINLAKIRGVYFTVEGTGKSGNLEINRVPEPPPLNYQVSLQNGYLILKDRFGTELGRIQVCTATSCVYAFTATQRGIYMAGYRGTYHFLNFVSYSNFTASGMTRAALPLGVTLGSPPVRFFADQPGLAEITGTDGVVRRINLDEVYLLNTSSFIGKIQAPNRQILRLYRRVENGSVYMMIYNENTGDIFRAAMPGLSSNPSEVLVTVSPDSKTLVVGTNPGKVYAFTMVRNHTYVKEWTVPPPTNVTSGTRVVSYFRFISTTYLEVVLFDGRRYRIDLSTYPLTVTRIS